MTAPTADEEGVCPTCGAGPGDDWNGKDTSCVWCDRWYGRS